VPTGFVGNFYEDVENELLACAFVCIRETDKSLTVEKIKEQFATDVFALGKLTTKQLKELDILYRL